MKKVVFIFGVLSLFLIPDSIWAKEPSCLETAMTQAEMNKCAGVGYNKADAELNRVYTLIRKLYKDDGVFLEKLKTSHLTWLKLRNADLALKFPHIDEPGYYGSVQSMCEDSFKTELTLARVAFLKTWLSGSKEGDVCSGSLKLDTALDQTPGKLAQTLNSKGFSLYKQGKYEEALNFFQRSFEADDAYHLAHYNFACTVSILLTQDVCRYLDYLESVFMHLEKTVRLKPEYKTKMRKDPDLKALRQFVRFHMIAGYDVNLEKDLFELLTSISWYGPKPGVYPASPVFKFNKDHSVKISTLKVSQDGITGTEYEYQTGRYTLEGKTIQITLDQKFKSRKKFEAEFKDGFIVFNGNAFSTLSDNQDLCDA